MNFKLFITSLMLIFAVSAESKDKKSLPLDEIYPLIEKAYANGWNESSPVDIELIQDKIKSAQELQEKRKKKPLNNLIQQIKMDLKVIEIRHEVNQLNQQLSQIKEENLAQKRTLDELKEQLK